MLYNLAISDIVVILFLIGFIGLKISVMIYRFNPANKQKLESDGLPRGTKIVGKIALFFSQVIIKIIILPLQKLLGLDRPFPEQFIKKHKKEFKDQFKLDSNLASYENYWLSYFFVSARNSVATSQIKNWLQLYSFARNTSAAAYLSLTIISIILIINSSYHNLNVFIVGMILYVIAIILMLRYWYLYSNYFIKNIIRSFIESAIK